MTFKNRLKNMIKQARREDGNALFLILIAVALFAGLSYAVTQSGRSSGQSVSEESNMILSSQVMQYPAGIRTGITRMLIRGTAVSELEFHDPSDPLYTAETSREVFHPDGGGVAYQRVIQDTVTDPVTDLWVFVDDVIVTNIATGGAEVVALLPDVRGGVCQQINEAATGSTAIPSPTAPIATMAAFIGGGFTLAGAGIEGQPFMCIEAADGTFGYYHVLVEQ